MIPCVPTTSFNVHPLATPAALRMDQVYREKSVVRWLPGRLRRLLTRGARGEFVFDDDLEAIDFIEVLRTFCDPRGSRIPSHECKQAFSRGLLGAYSGGVPRPPLRLPPMLVGPVSMSGVTDSGNSGAINQGYS